MPSVDVNIANRTFKLVCGEGQEPHLTSLAGQVSEKAEKIAATLKSVNIDSTILLMVALTLQDDLNDKSSSSGDGKVGSGEDYSKDLSEIKSSLESLFEKVS